MRVRTPCVGGPPQTCASGGPAGDVPANTSAIIVNIAIIILTMIMRRTTVITGRRHIIIAQAFLGLVFFLELTYWCLVGNQGSC